MLAFYQLKPFDGTITHYDVLDDGKEDENDSIIESDSDLTAGPTLRIIISSNGKTIVLNNFKVLGGSIATIDRLMKQRSCKLPIELWGIRYSALYD